VFKVFFISVFFFMSAAAPALAREIPAVDFNGRWQNDRGSVADLTIKNGEVHGFYQTNVGQPDKSERFALIGLTQGDQISFTVNFKDYGSMTAWVGQLVLDDKGKPVIHTLWHLTRDIEDAQEKDDLWGSVRTGASVFFKLK